MSFRDHFNQLKNKAEELNKKHNILPIGQNKPQQGYGPPSHQYYPGQHQPAAGQWQHPPPGQPGQQWQQPPQPNYSSRPGGPPPIPTHSRPTASPSPAPQGPRVYWRANFSPGIPVSQEFDQKQGHGDPWGWGNNELENYTSDSSNSFYTADNKLVVRAVSQQAHPDPEARNTSARLVSRQTLARPDGCLTAWLTMPCAEGIWPAFWLLPREPFVWPHEGEVDIAESWNGDCQNHSCLHWGFYTPEDAQKHLVRQTHIPDMPRRPIRFDFVWQCSGTGVRGDGKSAGGGRLMWYIDGRPVMKNLMPPGTRPIEDWCILLNVAMGGNVCQGKVPRDGAYDLVVHGLQMSEALDGGWERFDQNWHHCVDGAVM
ncbi:glycoside hydrolase family 16 protein [Biscogniauxia marginata]|nr:glycoside hydrolase family 16 protein [Biscogniauxia marginata]